MSRVELTIRRLVVHGAARFDSDAFSEALRREVAEQLRAGRKIVRETPARANPADGAILLSNSPAGCAGRRVAGSLFK
jgi:hypothetical protein